MFDLSLVSWEIYLFMEFPKCANMLPPLASPGLPFYSLPSYICSFFALPMPFFSWHSMAFPFLFWPFLVLFLIFIFPPLLIGANYLCVHGMEFYAIRQCYQYFGNDKSIGSYKGLWANIAYLAGKIQKNILHQ